KQRIDKVRRGQRRFLHHPPQASALPQSSRSQHGISRVFGHITCIGSILKRVIRRYASLALQVSGLFSSQMSSSSERHATSEVEPEEIISPPAHLTAHLHAS